MNKKSGSNPRPFRVCKAWFPYSRLDGLDSYFATIWAIQTTRTIISKRGLKLIKHVIWLTVSTSLPFTLALPLGEACFLGTPKLPSWRRVHTSRKFNFDLGVDRTVINVEGLSVTRNRSCLSRCAKCALRLTIEVYFRGVREGKPTFPSKSTVAVSNANPQLEIMDVIFETRKRVFDQDLQAQKRLLTTQDKVELSNQPWSFATFPEPRHSFHRFLFTKYYLDTSLNEQRAVRLLFS